MTFLAGLLGLAVGSLPTADWLARAAGFDLRTQGTGNPGTRNALAVGGRRLAAAVLLVELAKGAIAVTLGRMVGDDPGGAVAAVGAVAGNVYNPWFGFRGGKGLAITGGTMLAAWPPVFPVLAASIGLLAWLFRRSGPAALATGAIYAATAAVSLVIPLPVGWGILKPEWLVVAAVGSILVIAPKHFADTVTPTDRSQSPA